MQLQKITALSLAVVVTLAAHAEAQVYPWRSDATPPVGNRLRQRAKTPRIQPRSDGKVLVSFRQEENSGAQSVLGDQQPSVSDVPIPNVETPQAQAVPPIVEPIPQTKLQGTLVQPPAVQDWASPEPSLAITSNAGDEPNYCNRNCHTNLCNLGCERKLFPRNCNGLEIGGWTSVGYHNRSNRLFNNRPGEVELHQAWLYVDKQANRNTSGWNVGYRADLLYGIDGQDLQAFGNSPTGAPSGWDNSWDYGSFGWALPQAYVQFANYDWDVKVGKFFSPFGYETLGARDNFFYSHSLTRILSEPFTMSGVLGERTLDDRTSVVVGATAGWDTGFENNSGGNLILGIRRQRSEFVDFSLTASLGDTGYRETGIFTSAVTKVQLTGDLRYVLQIDNLNLDVNQEFGVVQYLFRDVTDCLSLGTRLEWWKSDRFFGGGNRSSYNFTLGANYRVNANLRVRPELRFDWGAFAIDPGQAIIGVDAVMTF